MKLERPFIVWHGQYQRIVTLDVHPFINLLVTGGSDEEVYEGEDLEFEEEIGYIKLWQINENYTPGQGGDAKPVTFIRALKKHSNPVNCVRFSPNGQYLASASDDHKIVIWHVDKGFQNISTNQKIFNLVPKNILEGHNREVCDLRWFNDSTHLISGGMDYRAYIWNVKEGVIKQTIVGAHKSYVQGVAVDPKMKFCLTLGNDRTVKVWRKLKSNNKKKNIFEYIPSNTMKRLPFADVNIEEEMLSDDEDKSSITGNQMNGANGAVNQAMTYGMFLSERQLNTFVKRPDWSPDGSFFLLPAAIYQEKRDSKIEMCVYLYRRNVLNKPSLIINTNNKPAICTRFCQKLFKKKEENQFSMVDIPYVIIFAISTIDNVMIYSTASLSPLAVVGNIHFALINDLTFFSNQSLIICSSDGMCSFVFFEENDLGKPLNSEEIQDEEIRNIVNVESFYPNELLRALVYPSQTKQILKEYNENIKQQQKQQQQITDINSQKEEKNKEYVVEKFNFACMEEEEQIIPIKPQEIQFKTTSTGEKKKVIIPAVIKKY
ncbi:chromatin assembly factor 1 subunit FAS2 (macronuclear) [Tetrahymena thermophila SB210]|uniref:Chromatin assembly factor 1 subunit FAS2 n=1 Tax=Tetrahymena thermophila (strain SB210) TaxID=312017 RepID=I7MFN1_TETTS|nr:chromatin assembly factor 1 subunit FAS2 [Tetrahymena thermophila SB210]EAS00369.1 chromatin assembly factor 1 subunit FAS2 [Tetrahymena thermophila SB210]|eukprot:XP_001020614.1 chromatin assembly factor 1 subunit FAS2 [Tetrahymena thermophila SB210]